MAPNARTPAENSRSSDTMARRLDSRRDLAAAERHRGVAQTMVWYALVIWRTDLSERERGDLMRRLEESDTSQLRAIAKSDLQRHPRAQRIVLERLALADRYAGQTQHQLTSS